MCRSRLRGNDKTRLRGNDKQRRRGNEKRDFLRLIIYTLKKSRLWRDC